MLYYIARLASVFGIFVLSNFSAGFSQTEKKLIKEVFISYENEFSAGNYIYVPIQIKQMKTSQEYVILDIGQSCIFVLSKDLKLLRRFGRLGQGPGDLLNPCCFDIDSNNNIYVLEYGNKRISVFNLDGKFKNSFRLSVMTIPDKAGIMISKNNTIVINEPQNEKFITEYSPDGKIIKQFGKINPDKSADLLWRAGYIVQANNSNYYVILDSYDVIQIYDVNGTLIKEQKISSIFTFLPTIEKRIENFKKLQKLVLGTARGVVLTQSANSFIDIRYGQGYIYIFPSPNYLGDSNNYKIFILNNNLENINTLNLPLTKEDFADKKYFLYRKNFEVLTNTDILFSIREKSEIYLFKNK